MKHFIQNMVVALFYLTTAFRIVALPRNGKIWAVLVSGGLGYKDYALQISLGVEIVVQTHYNFNNSPVIATANICHAYQILHKNGIPDQRIIVMMGDDIARHPSNPRPGIIINKAGGPNVYRNVPKDYTGRNVNANNFMGILLGNARQMSRIGSGKVLRSGPNDHVFIFFSGHGNKGIVVVGQQQLEATRFIHTLRTMHKRRRYRKMLIYMDACHSGSMFNNKAFDVRLGIYATTSACSKESSFIPVFDPWIRHLVGNEYAGSWMDHSDRNDPNAITVGQQFEKVRQRTNHSEAQEFGDKSIKKLKVGEFQGNRKKT